MGWLPRGAMTKRPNPLKAVSTVAQAVHLDGVRQLSGSYNVEVVSVPSTAELEEPGPRITFAKELDGDYLLSFVALNLKVQQQGQPPLHVVAVSGTFELRYRMTASFEEDELDKFAKINGIYHAWPYWREFVQNCTTRAGLPPLTLYPIVATDAARMAGLAPPAPAQNPKARGR